MPEMNVMEAREADYARLGDICAAAYVGAGVVGPDDAYVAILRDVAGRARQDLVLAAYDEHGRPVGTITVVTAGSDHVEIAREGEAELRMLAVDPAAQGRGAAARLVDAAVRAAAERGLRSVVLSSVEPPDVAARRYRRLGFDRAPERDWVADWDAEALAAGTAPTVPVWAITVDRRSS